MKVIENDKKLGKSFKVGYVFATSSKKMLKKQIRFKAVNWRYKQTVYRKGDRAFFIKGKRRYWCEVLGIIQTSTGIYCWAQMHIGLPPGPRWYQFTYAVKILEN